MRAEGSWHATRVLIFGSCVTRDGVDISWERRGLEIAAYVARQSWISAVAPADPALFDASQVTSPFQRRMIEGDVVGNALTTIERKIREVDYILCDLTDERLGVSVVPTGGYVTRVVNYDNGIYKGMQPLGPPITLLDSDHFDTWRRAADTFLARLDRVGASTRLIVNATPWADRDENGNAVNYVVPPAAFNAAIQKYHDHLEKSGVRLARPAPETVIALSNHQWGSAPFHYVREAYDSLLDDAFGPPHAAPLGGSLL